MFDMRTLRSGLKPPGDALSRARTVMNATSEPLDPPGPPDSPELAEPPARPTPCADGDEPAGEDASNAATPEFIQSLARGLAIIEAFGEAGEGLTLAEAARRTGISRASARRSLHTLEALGYASCDGHRFRLTPRVLQLGFSYLRAGDLWSAAQEPMIELSETIQESCSAAVLDGGEIVYVARVPTRNRVMSVTLGIGSRLPAVATSMGRVLLASLPATERDRLLAQVAPRPGTAVMTGAALARELERVAAQGHALVDQELEPGLRSVAVPIRDARDRVIAALNVGTHAGRVSIERLRGEILPALLSCAGQIHAALGGRPPR